MGVHVSWAVAALVAVCCVVAVQTGGGSHARAPAGSALTEAQALSIARAMRESGAAPPELDDDDPSIALVDSRAQRVEEGEPESGADARAHEYDGLMAMIARDLGADPTNTTRDICPNGVLCRADLGYLCCSPSSTCCSNRCCASGLECCHSTNVPSRPASCCSPEYQCDQPSGLCVAPDGMWYLPMALVMLALTAVTMCACLCYCGARYHYFRRHGMRENTFSYGTFSNGVSSDVLDRIGSFRYTARTAGADGSVQSADDVARESCSICLAEYNEGDELRKLPCAHQFHMPCIDRWLRDHNTCPLCVAVVS